MRDLWETLGMPSLLLKPRDYNWKSVLVKEKNLLGSLKTKTESLNLELWLYKAFITHCGKIMLLKNYLENLLCFASKF